MSRRNEKSAQRLSFEAGYPAGVQAHILAGRRPQSKLRSGPQKYGKTSILVRTYMTSKSRRRLEVGEVSSEDTCLLSVYQSSGFPNLS